MKKIFSLIALVLLTLAIVGCTPKEEERTYKADGVYVAWELSTNQATLYLADGSSFKNAENATVKVTAPVLSLVRVEIRNDEIVDFYIDEIQSKATATVNAENALDITAVSFAFNAQSKKELEYSYGMEKNGKLGEWFIQATIIENNWLTSGVVAELPAASATITHDNYVTLAQEAIQKAKDGKVSAVYAETNCVHFVEGDIDEEGKISNVSLDAHYFNYIDKSTDQYDETNATKYLVFAWDAESKYESYPEMLPGKSWQTMIDTLVSYINANGWDGTLLSGYYKDVSGTPTYQAGKGLNINDVNVEALASVTITVSNQVLVMNMLWKYFPEGWTE